MILTIVYSGNLTAFLLVRRPPTSIETIEDLYRSGLEVAALGDIYLGGIKSASDPNLRVSQADLITDCVLIPPPCTPSPHVILK